MTPSLELFAPRQAAVVRVAATDASVPWPAGSVRWDCGGRAPDGAWEADDRRYLLWALPHCRVELSLWRVVPELPDGMRITEGWMGHWRARPEPVTRLPPLRCSLTTGKRDFEASPESGENLDAQTWEDGRHRITIGTEDADGLGLRAGGSLPAEWRAPLRSYFDGRVPSGWEYPVRLEPDGVVIALPRAPHAQVCDLHHAVAWQRVGTGHECSTWLAVDLTRAALPAALRT